MLRLALALSFGAIVTLFVWWHIGTELSVTTDIVGNTTFSDLDAYRYIYRFYDISLVLPVATSLAFVLMARFGPLRSAPTSKEWPPLLVETETVPECSPPSSTLDATEDIVRVGSMDAVWALARVALVAATVGVEANVADSVHIAELTRFGIGAACMYVAVVVIVTVVLGWRRSSSASMGRRRDAGNGGMLSRSLSSDLPVVNALGSVVVIPLLILVSSSTSVTVAADGHVIHYAWFPAWFGAIVTGLVLLLLVRVLLRAHTSASRRMFERRMLLIVVVPILLFMMTASIQGAQGPFQGFDDAQAMVGAQLTFWHGLWPWRDLYLLHGALYDSFYGAIGMWVLSPTRWGANSGQTLFVMPFTIVALYGFIVYFARKNTLLVVAGTLALLLPLLSSWWDTRYVLIALVLILFDRVLRRGSWARCLLFMLSVVFLSILTPEATLLMVGVLATLVVAEAIHRPPHQPLREGFSRTIRCAATGAACVGLWGIFLAANGAMSGFLDYYETAATGHELWGALTPQWSTTATPQATVAFALPILLFLMTVWKVVSKLLRRSSWRPIEWVLVASSTPVLLFYQVVLDRMDYPHVLEVFQTLVPFVLLWAIEIVRFGDAHAARIWNSLSQRWSAAARIRLAVPITLLVVIALAVDSLNTAATWRNIPQAFHGVVPVEAPRDLPLGYTQPGAIDVDQLRDLQKVLDRYAGKDGPVFDFVNEMGATYFLLDRVPGARFYHVESAQSARAQNIEVDDLRLNRPNVVIFNDTTWGLPNYDGIYSMERNYIVSQYILDNYVPLLDTHWQLIMLRKDLVSRANPLPTLSQPPVTSNLYFDVHMPACDWGDVPNFLIHPSSNALRAGLDLNVTHVATNDLISVRGWAFDTLGNQPARSVLAVSDGQVVDELRTDIGRPDVADALHSQSAVNSGYKGSFFISADATFQLYALNVDGTLTPLAGTSGQTASASVTTPDGIVHSIRPTGGEGVMDSESEATWRSYNVVVPQGTNLSEYQWMMLQSPRALGSSRVKITDSLVGGLPHVIAWNTLPRTGYQVFTRVGSCLQWHGYHTTSLTMLTRGPATSFSVRLLK
jgi:hypothetical protein